MEVIHVLLVTLFGTSQLIGNPLLLGILYYEKNGGDSMKRNLIDMVIISRILTVLVKELK